MIIGGIIYNEPIIGFMDDLITEYDQRYDEIVSKNRMTSNDSYKKPNIELNDSLAKVDGNHLFGGLKVGMSPFEVVCHIRKMGGLDVFHVGNVYFNWCRRNYFENELYGISMSFGDIDNYAYADSLVCFLKQKYGNPHLYVKKEAYFSAKWCFNYKHIAVDSKGRLLGGVLYIYHPVIMANKMAVEVQKEREYMDKLLKEKQKREDEEKQEKLKLMEELREKEEKNSRLQNGL